MNEDLRARVLVPVLLPMGLVGAIAVFAWSLSRVFLALPAAIAALIALLVAGYLLAIAALVSRSGAIPARSLGVGLAVGLLGVVAAGTAASVVGPRELHASGEEETAEGEGQDEGEGEEAEIPQDAFVFEAVDIDWGQVPERVDAGMTTLAIVNEGNITHNLVIEELGDELVAEAPGGAADAGEVSLETGQDYTYYCSIPGHREAGMEGTLTAEE